MDYYNNFVFTELCLNGNDPESVKLQLSNTIINMNHLFMRDIDRFDLVLKLDYEYQKVEIVTKIFGLLFSVQAQFFSRKPLLEVNLLLESLYNKEYLQEQLKNTNNPLINIKDISIGLESQKEQFDKNMPIDNNSYDDDLKSDHLVKQVSILVDETFRTKDNLTNFKEKNVTCIGGTCDHFHSGHKMFFASAALNTKKLLCGLTNKFMLAKKEFSEVLEEPPMRQNSAKNFFKLFDKTLEVEVFELKDGYGPIDRADLDSIILTPETLKGGEACNKKRAECYNLGPLDFVMVPLVIDEEIGDKTSSTYFRKYISHKIKLENGIKVLRDSWAFIKETLYSEPQNEEAENWHACWFCKLVNMYSDSRRFYHTNDHVIYMLNAINSIEFDTFITDKSKKDEFKALLMLFSFFHDCIYWPRSTTNEELSALMFEMYSKHLGLQDDHRESVQRAIILSKNHLGHTDLTEFERVALDVDQLILSEKKEIYKEYAQNVYQEYGHIKPLKELYTKRIAFLTDYNKHEHFYTSKYYANLSLDECAHTNLKSEISELSELIK